MDSEHEESGEGVEEVAGQGMSDRAVQDDTVTTTTTSEGEEISAREIEQPLFSSVAPTVQDNNDPWVNVLDVLPDGRPFAFWTRRSALRIVREWDEFFELQQREFH